MNDDGMDLQLYKKSNLMHKDIDLPYMTDEEGCKEKSVRLYIYIYIYIWKWA